MTTDWMRDAACRDAPYDTMFPESARGAADAARALCSRCPVRQPCLDYAIEHGERHGVFGGLTEVERRPLRRRWIAERGLEVVGNGRIRAGHGTDSRYRSGCRCEECRAAHAAKQRRARA